MQHRRFSRLLTLATLVLMLMVIGGSAIQAQTDCMGLAQADCDILEAANANMDMVDSMTFDLSAELTVSGLELMAMLVPGLPGAMELTLESDGVLDGTNEAAQIFFDLAAEMAMEEASATGTLILIDEVVYMIDEDGQAYGVKPSDIDTADLPVEVDMEDMDVMELADALDFDIFAATFAGFGMDPSEYMSFARLDDVEMMGMTMYPFEFSMDIGALLNSPEFAEVLGMLAGFGDDPSMAGMAEMIPMLMQGIESELSLTEYVGEDGYVHGFAFSFGLVMDLSAMFGPGEPIEILVALDLGMDDINSAPAVSAPSDVTILSEDEAEAMMTEMFADFEDMFAGFSDMMP